MKNPTKCPADTAIIKHVKFKVMLKNYVEAPRRPHHDVTHLCDERCSVKNWLVAQGQKYRTDPEFEKLLVAHKKYHEEVEKIIIKVKRRDPFVNMDLSGIASKYERASTLIISTLAHFKTIELKEPKVFPNQTEP